MVVWGVCEVTLPIPTIPLCVPRSSYENSFVHDVVFCLKWRLYLMDPMPVWLQLTAATNLSFHFKGYRARERSSISPSRWSH